VFSEFDLARRWLTVGSIHPPTVSMDWCLLHSSHCPRYARFARLRTSGALVAMSKRLTFFCVFSLVLGTTANANAASTLKITCVGNLTNTRADGVTLAQCDLNFISVKEMTEIADVCGIPGTIDSPAENQCRIRAVVSPVPTRAADQRKLYSVLEVWSVDKR
jgi:hypothetical protein